MNQLLKFNLLIAVTVSSVLLTACATTSHPEHKSACIQEYYKENKILFPREVTDEELKPCMERKKSQS